MVYVLWNKNKEKINNRFFIYCLIVAETILLAKHLCWWNSHSLIYIFKNANKHIKKTENTACAEYARTQCQFYTICMAYSSHFSCINNGEKKQIVPFNLRREKNVSTALVRVLCRCECEWVCYVTNNATFYSHSFNIQYCTWLFIYFIIFFFFGYAQVLLFFQKKKWQK